MSYISSTIETNCPVINTEEITLGYVRQARFRDHNPPGERFVRVAVFLPVTGTRIINTTFADTVVMDWTLVERGSTVRFYRADTGGCVFRIV